MSRLIRTVSAVCLMLILAAVPAAGQDSGFGTLPACAQLAPYFCVDAGYLLDGDAYMLVVCLRVCNEGLQFVRVDGGYEATADVAVVVEDHKGRQVTGDTYRVRLEAERYTETTSVDSCETRSLSFGARPGDFEMAVTVRDGDSGRKSRVKADIAIPSLDGRPMLSDVFLLRRDGGSAGGMWEGFSPNVSRVYSASSGDVVFYYEVYSADGGDSVTVTNEVVHSSGAVVLKSSEVLGGEAVARNFVTVPLDSLSNGRHTLTVSIAGPNGKPIVSRSKEFEVRTTRFYFSKNSEEAAAILAYIASSELIDRFLEAGKEERKRIWERFWREHDPTPTTPKNEFYEEHMKRFTYANEHFSTSRGEGWRTDMGKVYIIHGPPDEIDDYPMEVGRNPIQVWYYMSNGTRFVFVDETGFGDYVLARER
jgi:GWxTD domain-containing protein